LAKPRKILPRRKRGVVLRALAFACRLNRGRDDSEVLLSVETFERDHDLRPKRFLGAGIVMRPNARTTFTGFSAAPVGGRMVTTGGSTMIR
jgi:hypothetical protein